MDSASAGARADLNFLHGKHESIGRVSGLGGAPSRRCRRRASRWREPPLVLMIQRKQNKTKCFIKVIHATTLKENLNYALTLALMAFKSSSKNTYSKVNSVLIRWHQPLSRRPTRSRRRLPKEDERVARHVPPAALRPHRGTPRPLLKDRLWY